MTSTAVSSATALRPQQVLSLRTHAGRHTFFSSCSIADYPMVRCTLLTLVDPIVTTTLASITSTVTTYTIATTACTATGPHRYVPDLNEDSCVEQINLCDRRKSSGPRWRENHRIISSRRGTVSSERVLRNNDDFQVGQIVWWLEDIRRAIRLHERRRHETRAVAFLCLNCLQHLSSPSL